MVPASHDQGSTSAADLLPLAPFANPHPLVAAEPTGNSTALPKNELEQSSPQREFPISHLHHGNDHGRSMAPASTERSGKGLVLLTQHLLRERGTREHQTASQEHLALIAATA
ncbi:uncharacterized protein RCC_06474 [Ramularia collo-cygni]|uniref:Uncharacterized protein n=1 Tax=Ramularia collo-cygni TaxID=112498 RepID=A0A2D3VAD8_9PEZI|nr:uncharacterized protein RCC_06474 [Ramularia collo-cygni]CZT20616.1 uncharacterized protein RCC_06474 [Ramularia collo-cygni]